MLFLAAGCSTSSRPIHKRLSSLSLIVGLIAIAISSSAISYWLYGAACICTVLWVASQFKQGSRKKWPRWLFVVAWAACAAAELPYHLSPTLNPATSRSLTVIGDSVSAGMGGNDKAETWPSIFGSQHDVRMQDLSHAGETAKSALKRTQKIPVTGSVVLIEIGGNDLLGSTSTSQFEDDLDALLSHLEHHDRQLVMLELPLPPFCHTWGKIQRQQAAKHGVALVPKRVFYSVLAGEASTLDSIHLSQAGHKKMADKIWNAISKALEIR